MSAPIPLALVQFVDGETATVFQVLSCVDWGNGMHQACPSENRNRTLYSRRMRLGTILAADFLEALRRA